VWEDRRIRIDQTDEAVALHVLFIALNELVAERSAATDLVLHASAASIDGQVVAFAGRGGAGKSRLAMWAAQHGDGFVCEDVCAVDDDGRVRPFHRPAGLHPDGAAELGVAIPEGPFGWVFPFPVGECATLTPGGPLGMIVLAQRSRGAPGVSRIAPPDALARLSPMTIATPGSEAAMFRRLERTVRRVPVVELTYRDVREVPDLMRAELAP
jgi:hypothetical protein